ncbi:MAG: hypothetical protein Q7R87_05095 [Nanoarchaeota archaeon]|nr:hypothetical protein [Nanoarchaeota archaeon]
MVLTFNQIHRKALEKGRVIEQKKALEILKDIEILSRRVGTHIKLNNKQLKVELSGGLAIPLTISRSPDISKFLGLPVEQRGIYRNHSAFHLSMYAPELLNLEGVLTNPSHTPSKYALVTHLFSTGLKAIHWKVDRYEKITAKQAIDEKVHNLRFVEIDKAGDILWPHKTRLSYFDVYPFFYETREGKKVTPWHNNQFAIMEDHKVLSASEVKVTSWDKQELSLPASLYSPIELEIGYFTIRIAGLPWIRLVKEKRKKQDDVDRHDLGIIDRYLNIQKAQGGN